ncbi:hypothetical protein IAT38_001512 [Cryptococcus sp. DSM 104549]
MSLLAESLAGAKYMVSTNDDRESSTNGAAEFMRRKKWPEILLKELVGAAIFCLKPALVPRQEGHYQNGEAWGWKMIYVSPAVQEMLGPRPGDLEGRDFFELVYAPDHTQLRAFFNSLLAPPLLNQSDPFSPPSSTTLGESQTTYIRMLSSASSATPSRSSSTPGSGLSTPSLSGGMGVGMGGAGVGVGVGVGVGRSKPVVWEVRGHATGVGEDMAGFGYPGTSHGKGKTGVGAPGLNTAGAGAGDEGGMRYRAVWVVGRSVAEPGEGEQSFDQFLDLKLENERLRAELLELREDLGEDSAPRKTSYPSSTSSKPNRSSSSSSRSPSPPHPHASSSSHPASYAKPKQGRPAKIDPTNKNGGKKAKTAGGQKDGGPGGAGAGEAGMYVCVTCGRTDSPEWRKGPLGPKTLCNACGLRWAKRNSAVAGAKRDKKE